MSQVLQIQEENSVLKLSLSRPEVRNAMNEELINGLYDFFKTRDFSSSRAVVLRGEGEFFCAGGDLNWMKSSMDKSPEENEKDALQLAKMIRAVDECPVPVICLVQGGAFGGGVGLVAGSDIVIADSTARFSLSEVKLGLIPATIGPMVLRKIGYSQARRLYLTGLIFDASQAQSFNLVHEVVGGQAQMQESLNSYLKELGRSGPQAVRRAKTLIREMMGSKLWSEDISEATSKVLSEVRIGDEAQEGMAAFLEKRKASWAEKLISS